MAEHFTYLSSGGVTDVGSRRKNNQDSILLLPEHGVFCVADGMGGVQGGEVASQAVVTFLTKAHDKLEGPEAAESVVVKAQLIDRALNSASAWIKQRSDKKGIKGCGTTAVLLAFDGRNPRHGMILHAGDSRAYRYREGELKQLSKDHTVAAAAGLENDDDLPAMFRGVVTRAVGVKARVEVEKTPIEVRTGDIYLLASDGLDKMVSDPEIQARIDEGADGEMQQLAQVLVDDANRNGGVDNVSVMMIRVDEPGEAVTASDDEIIKEVNAYLAEDERLRELGVLDDAGDGERYSGEADTPPSGSIQGVTPSHGSAADDESDTDDRAIPVAGPLTPYLDKWLALPIGVRYAFAIALLVFVALVVIQIRRGREAGDDDPGSRSPRPTLLTEEPPERAPEPTGPRVIPVLLPEAESTEPEPELTPEERQAQVDRMLQELETLAPKEPGEDVGPDPGVEEPAEPAEPVDPVERARLEQERQRFEREERAARSPARQAQVRAALPGRIEAALASGRWGELRAHVDEWQPYIDGLVEGSGQALVYHGWLEVWDLAQAQSAEVVARLLATYEDRMGQIFGVCGFEPATRPEVTLGAEPGKRADRYCARLHAWQTDLAGQSRAFADLHAKQSRLLPDDPERAFRNLWLFTGQTDTSRANDAVRRLAEGRTELDRLKTWLAVRSEEPFPAEEFGMVPLGAVPVVRQQFDAVWESLYTSAALIAPQLSVWRNWEDATLADQLDIISDLQNEVVLSRAPYSDDSAAWRAAADHSALSRLLIQVDKVYPLLRRKIDAAKR